MNEQLVKLHIDLPNHWGASGESFWALPLGNDVYEVRNLLFYAYNIHYEDHVRAVAASQDLVPEVTEVVARSGHQTIRVMFFDMIAAEKRTELLDSLAPLGVSYEGATPKYFALDLEADADVATVRGILDQQEAAGVLSYETCEEKFPGTFDDAPEA